MISIEWKRIELIRKILGYYHVDIKTFGSRPKLLFLRIHIFIKGKWLVYFSKRKAEFQHEMPLEIVIPSIEKDFAVLPYCIKSARENIKHPIKKIHIIAPFSEEIITFCHENDCNFIDENNMLPIKRSDITYEFEGLDKSGWLFQQLIKLNIDTIGNTENILVLDSDTVFINPVEFSSKGKTIFYFSDCYVESYARAYYNIFKRKMDCPVSFVAHHMVFNKKWLRELKNEISKIYDMEWYKVILNSTIKNAELGFSEFEIYGNYVYKNYNDKILFRFWFNRSVFRRYLSEIDSLKRKYENRKLTLSFHSFDY
jgi:hypothetical protein